MDQGKLFWPNFWLKENWSRFDYGILPGRNWLICGSNHLGMMDRVQKRYASNGWQNLKHY